MQCIIPLRRLSSKCRPNVLQEVAEAEGKKDNSRIGQHDGKDMLQLLRDCSGAFRPGILTALVGSSGAGKTTLMDVLAGRKTSESCLARAVMFCTMRNTHKHH